MINQGRPGFSTRSMLLARRKSRRGRRTRPDEVILLPKTKVLAREEYEAGWTKLLGPRNASPRAKVLARDGNSPGRRCSHERMDKEALGSSGKDEAARPPPRLAAADDDTRPQRTLDISRTKDSAPRHMFRCRRRCSAHRNKLTRAKVLARDRNPHGRRCSPEGMNKEALVLL